LPSTAHDNHASAAIAPSVVRHTVNDDEDGLRLDRMLAAIEPTISRSRLQGLVRNGHVTIDGAPSLDPGLRVRRGQDVILTLPPPAPAAPQAENLPLAVVFEDPHVIVIDKPAGLVVHPGAGHATGTLVNALIAHCGDSLSGIGGVKRPGIVHRLDKDTSGLLVVAKTDAAHAGLSEQFASHGEDGRLRRTYLAVCWGVPPRGKGTIDAALSRSVANRLKIAVVPQAAGRRAVTHYEVLETFNDQDGAPLAALVRLSLETGRTHQIRVHLTHIAHPLLGDPVYGRGFLTRAARLPAAAQAALKALDRQALHAAELGFEHPISGKSLLFQAPLPPDLEELVAALRGKQPVRRGRSAKLKVGD
jgi:23S rRNA pseudouridine1911/1915/1917 synthase